jgi:hypothetical protein
MVASNFRLGHTAAKKSLRTSVIDMIMPSLPAAASKLNCRHSHPDCRATRARPGAACCVVCPCAAPRIRCQGLGRARCHPAGRRDRRAGWRLGDPALCSGGVKPSRAEKLGVVASHVDQNRELGIPAEAITGFAAGVTNTYGGARALSPWAAANGAKGVIVPTGLFSSRRVPRS